MSRRTFLVLAALFLTGCAASIHREAATFRSDRILVVTTGSGPDVVLVHGLSSSREVWNGIVAAVPGYRYHFVQLNGFAGHPAFGDASSQVIASSTEEIARYIREMRLDRPAIVGHSMGGTSALGLAARHGIVSRVVVMDMLPFLGACFSLRRAPAPRRSRRQPMRFASAP